MKKLLSLVMLVAFLPMFQTGNFYYVSPNGSDNNSGSMEQPFRTIQHAADVAKSGDTIYVRAGTYNERVRFWYKQNTNWITVTNYPGEVATLDGTNLAISGGEGLFFVQRTDYIRVSGLHIQHSNGAGIDARYMSHFEVLNNHTHDTVNSGISTWGVADAKIDGNEVTLACNAHPGYTVSEENISIAAGSSNVEVSNNLVHKAASIPDGYSGGEGINIKDGAHDVIVHDNVVHLDERADGKKSNRLAFGVDGWSHETYNIKIYNNTAYNSLYGFVIESEAGATVHDVQVYDNLAYNNGRAGFSMPTWAQNETSLKRNVVFEDNVAYGNGYGVLIESKAVQNIVIQNNNLTGNGKAIQVAPGVPQSEVVVSNNQTGQPTPTRTPLPTSTPTPECFDHVWLDGTQITVCKR